MDHCFRLIWIIGRQRDYKIMRTIHPGVHHKGTGLDRCRLARFQRHRTDGKLWRSAPLQDFDVRHIFKAQGAITGNYQYSAYLIPTQPIPDA
jgi:hypothetical protein